MDSRWSNIYQEPEVDPRTLNNLGPLTGLAGVWLGEKGIDTHPTENGSCDQIYVERYDLQPIDPQTNGPQLFYGLRYHTRITLPNDTTMFHEQVGFWLWEPDSELVILTIAIPRGQVAMASGKASRDAKRFTVTAMQGSSFSGILSNPFLEEAFNTTNFEMTVTLEDGDSWSYEQMTTLMIRGRNVPFHHSDRNSLKRLAPPTVNPAAQKT